MKQYNIVRVLEMLLILSVLVLLTSWGVIPMVLRASDPNLRSYHDIDSGARLSRNQDATPALLQYYVAHEPILIKGNADFVALGFPGNGSPSNPYIIEGLNITLHDLRIAVSIHIQDTTAYFCIRNNYLTLSKGLAGADGISLGNVIHGTIDTNIVTNCTDGIVLGSAENNTVSHNTVFNCDRGIRLEGSDHNTLAHNTVSHNNRYGISLWRAGNNTVSHNTISNCGGGISLEESGQSTVSHNTVSNCGGGIGLKESGQNTLVGNSLVNNGLSISGDQIEHYLQASVAENVVNGRPLIFWQQVSGGTVPPGAGQILLIQTTGVEVTGQDLARATIGVLTAFSSNLTIHHNTISDCGAGISLYAFGSSTLTHNTVSNCERGIRLEESDHNTLAHNTVSNNSYGICLEESGHNTLTHNTVSNCGDGIFLQKNSGNNTVSHNTVSNSNDPGIHLSHCGRYAYNTLAHNTISYCGRGISLWYSGHNTIFNNTISNHRSRGIYIGEAGGHNAVSYNTISYNSGDGIHIDSRDNTVEWNDFMGNNPGGRSQAGDDGSSDDGDNIFAHNYWDDHDNMDRDGDGIADAPYVIEGEIDEGVGATNQDPFPLVAFANPHCLSIPTITYPYVGETLQGTVTLQWAAAIDTWDHSVTYTVSYSADGGSSWISLASGLPTSSYEWNTITVAESPTYLIQVVATCSEGFMTEDRSDAPFSIKIIAHSLSAPEVSYPNGGETLQGTVTLQWAAATDSWEHSVTYTVSYSEDSGSTWIPLAVWLPIPKYEWDTTKVADGPTYLIQVVATCSEGFSTEDISDTPFTIQNPETTTPSPPETTTPTTETSTSLLPVVAFLTPGGPVGILLVTFLLATIPVRRWKRKSR